MRQAIYNTLIAFANYNTNAFFREFIDFHIHAIPDYWEDPELYPSLKKALLESPQKRDINFQSAFLNEQMATGNLFLSERTGCIEILPSYDFNNVPGDKHKHRNKISAQLRKEGYVYLPALCGYIK